MYVRENYTLNIFDVILYSLVWWYQRFRATCSLHFQDYRKRYYLHPTWCHVPKDCHLSNDLRKFVMLRKLQCRLLRDCGQWMTKWNRLFKKVFMGLYSVMVIQHLVCAETLWLDSNSSKTAVEKKCNSWVNMWNKPFEI